MCGCMFVCVCVGVCLCVWFLMCIVARGQTYSFDIHVVQLASSLQVYISIFVHMEQ